MIMRLWLQVIDEEFQPVRDVWGPPSGARGNAL